MNDTPPSPKNLADFLPSVEELAKKIAKLPEESQARIRAEFAERPVIRTIRIVRTRKK